MQQPSSTSKRLRPASMRKCLNNDSDEEGNTVPHEVELPYRLRSSGFTASPSSTSPSSSASLNQASDANATSHKQLDSAFFAKLPLEVRRLIYTELWRSSNPLMKMHLHSSPPTSDSPSTHDLPDSPASDARLMATACHYAPTATYSTLRDKKDPVPTAPWETWNFMGFRAPAWLRHAWRLRSTWGVHWKCQAAVMAGARPSMGASHYNEGRAVTHGGLTGCFLTCKRMYVSQALHCLLASNSSPAWLGMRILTKLQVRGEHQLPVRVYRAHLHLFSRCLSVLRAESALAPRQNPQRQLCLQRPSGPSVPGANPIARPPIFASGVPKILCCSHCAAAEVLGHLGGADAVRARGDARVAGAADSHQRAGGKGHGICEGAVQLGG